MSEKTGGFFIGKTETLRMKRNLQDYSNTNLLPSGEIKETKRISEDKILKITRVTPVTFRFQLFTIMIFGAMMII